MKSLKKNLKEFMRYPTAVVGLVIILLMILLSIYTLITIPYSEAVRLWRGGEAAVYQLPKNVPPAWTNFFRRDKLPETIILSSKDGDGTKVITPTENGEKIDIKFTFDYSYSQLDRKSVV